MGGIVRQSLKITYENYKSEIEDIFVSRMIRAGKRNLETAFEHPKTTMAKTGFSITPLPLQDKSVTGLNLPLDSRHVLLVDIYFFSDSDLHRRKNIFTSFTVSGIIPLKEYEGSLLQDFFLILLSPRMPRANIFSVPILTDDGVQDLRIVFDEHYDYCIYRAANSVIERFIYTDGRARMGGTISSSIFFSFKEFKFKTYFDEEKPSIRSVNFCAIKTIDKSRKEIENICQDLQDTFNLIEKNTAGIFSSKTFQDLNSKKKKKAINGLVAWHFDLGSSLSKILI